MPDFNYTVVNTNTTFSTGNQLVIAPEHMVSNTAADRVAEIRKQVTDDDNVKAEDKDTQFETMLGQSGFFFPQLVVADA